MLKNKNKKIKINKNTNTEYVRSSAFNYDRMCIQKALSLNLTLKGNLPSSSSISFFDGVGFFKSDFC